MRNKLYTVEEVSELCGVRADAVVRWIDSGELPTVHTSDGSKQVAAGDLARFMSLRDFPLPDELRSYTSDGDRSGELDFLFEAVFENSPVAVQIVDREGWTLKINRSLSRAFGVSPDDIVGVGKHNFFTDTRLQHAGLVEAVNKAFEGETVTIPFAQFEIGEAEHPLEENMLAVRAVAFPIEQNGHVGHVGVIYEDITEKAMLQRSLIAKNAELESFVYTVAHDLKSPLSVITSAGEALREATGGDGRAGEHVSMIMRSSERMLEFIDGLLSLSRAGRYDDEQSYETPASTIVKSILLEMRSAHPGEDMHLEQGELPAVNLHPDAATHLFQNLITNAYNYRHPERALKLRVDCNSSGKSHRFSVSDNGIGIKSADRAKIFDVFYRAEGTSVSGTGLGLAIVRRIVEKAGGRVWVDSHPGKGSTFYFTIPR